MEKHIFQKKPPLSSGYFSPVSKVLLNVSTSPSLPDTNKTISDIIQEEHTKLQHELQKLSNLRARTGFSQNPHSPPYSGFHISSDTDEFKSPPISSVLHKPSPLKYIIHRKEEKYSSKSQTTKDFFFNKSSSESSEELLLSTYEDSLVLSPPQCTSPTYVRTNNKHQSPKLFMVKSGKPIVSTENKNGPSRSSSTSSREVLVSRLASGSTKKLSKKEIYEVNRRMYERLPEVVEKKNREIREMEKKVHAMYLKGTQQKLKDSRKKNILKSSATKK